MNRVEAIGRRGWNRNRRRDSRGPAHTNTNDSIRSSRPKPKPNILEKGWEEEEEENALTSAEIHTYIDPEPQNLRKP